MDLSLDKRHGTVPGGPRFGRGGLVFELPSRYSMVATDVPGLPYRVEFVVVASAGSRPQAESVTLVQLVDEHGRPAGPPVTSAALRRVAVAELVRLSVEVAAQVLDSELPTRDPETETSGKLRPPTDEETTELRKRRRRRVDSELLANVAELYREAARVGQAPTQAVADTLGVPRSTAGRYVVRARREGHLGPAPGRRIAGEALEGGTS
jgi:hypothetical protein